MARGCQAWRCSDSLTFTEWPVLPWLPLFEKFKSARIHRGDAMACRLTRFPVCLQASPPSLLRTCHPPADDSCSTLINPTFLFVLQVWILLSCCRLDRVPCLVEIEQPAQPSSLEPGREDYTPPPLSIYPPLLSFTHSICLCGFGRLAGWMEETANTLGLTLSSLFKFFLLLSNL